APAAYRDNHNAGQLRRDRTTARGFDRAGERNRSAREQVRSRECSDRDGADQYCTNPPAETAGIATRRHRANYRDATPLPPDNDRSTRQADRASRAGSAHHETTRGIEPAGPRAGRRVAEAPAHPTISPDRSRQTPVHA